MTQEHFGRTVLTFAVLFLGTLEGMAQSTPTVEAGRGEVYGFGGVLRGEGLTVGTGGGGGAFTASRHFRMFGEALYFKKDLSDVLGVRDVKASAWGFEGGAQVLFPLSDSRAVPFVTGAIGWARVKGSAGRVSATEWAGHVGFGGGLDYYLGNNWGIRPEFRWYTANEYRATAGVFFRF
jgi:hypothetical protein